MKLKPMGTRLLAKQYEEEKIGEIIMSDMTKKMSLKAEVIAIGEDCDWIKVGDKILFGRFARFDVPFPESDWRDYFIMNEEDILCKIEEE